MDQKQISCRKVALFGGAMELIQRSEKTNLDTLDWVHNQIKSGHILLFEVIEDGERIGIFTGCVERELGRPNNLLILHAVSIEERETPFICTLFPLIHNLVKSSGLESWTVHSQRPGMDRLLKQHGFQRLETIYKRKI